MSRLYDITYNKEQWMCKWICKDSRGSGHYTFVNKATLDAYSIGGDIIGIEQIDDNSFLVYRRIMRDRWQISRIVFDSGCSSLIFSEEFEKFYFLSEDTILFDSKCVYSISKNCRVPEFEWLKYKDLEVITDEKKNLTYLLVKQKIFHSNDYVQVFVDTKTFKPVTHASSSLRKNHNITLSDEFTFDDLVKEDERSANIIFWENFHNTESSVNTGTKTLMEELQITN